MKCEAKGAFLQQAGLPCPKFLWLLSAEITPLVKIMWRLQSSPLLSKPHQIVCSIDKSGIKHCRHPQTDILYAIDYKERNSFSIAVIFFFLAIIPTT